MEQTKPIQWGEWLLAGLVVLLVAARFVFPHLDPPAGIAAPGGFYLTDEGWYSKAAQLFVKFGVWQNAHDYQWHSHTPLYALLLTVLFKVFGVSLVVVRLFSASMFAVSMGIFYGLCRRVQPRIIALLTCLLVLVTFDVMAYSRMALIEPTSVALSLGALYCWVRWPEQFWSCALSLLLALCAYLTKSYFAFTLLTVGLLWSGSALWGFANGKRITGVGLILVLLAGVLLTFGARAAVRAWVGEGFDTFEAAHVQARFAELNCWTVLQHQWAMLSTLLFNKGRIILLISLAAAAAGWVATRRWEEDAFFLPRRPTAALLLWAVIGIPLMGSFGYQPGRYFYFATFCLALFVTTLWMKLIEDRRRLVVAVSLTAALHAAAQWPSYRAWLAQDDLYTAHKMANSVVDHLPKDRVTVLMGSPASFVSFYSSNVRPVDWEYHQSKDFALQDRILVWRPDYFLARSDSELDIVMIAGTDILANAEIVDTYEVMGNWYTGENVTLYRLTYKDSL